jgi:hypothetical protein
VDSFGRPLGLFRSEKQPVVLKSTRACAICVDQKTAGSFEANEKIKGPLAPLRNKGWGSKWTHGERYVDEED